MWAAQKIPSTALEGFVVRVLICNVGHDNYAGRLEGGSESIVVYRHVLLHLPSSAVDVHDSQDQQEAKL